MSDQMTVSAKIDKKGGKEQEYRFTLRPSPLGAGATAVVYRGVTDSSHQVAVKVARAGSTREDLRKFWKELDILEQLYKGDSPHVPWAVKGKMQGEPKRAIIVLELIPEKHELRRQTNNRGMLDEDLAIATGYQYAELLALMHERNIVSRGDRKAADLRWIASEKRLVVLDWNRARTLLPADPELPAYMRQDLRVFGRLWAEHILGRNVDKLPAVEETADERWSDLTLSLRVILSNSLNTGPDRGYQNGADLKQALSAHKRRSKATKNDILEDAGKLASGEAEAPVAPDDPATEMKVLIDWAREKGAIDDEIDSFQQWAQQVSSEAGRLAEKTVENVRRNSFALSHFDRAIQEAEQALDELKAQRGDTARYRLRVYRWWTAAKALESVKGDINFPEYTKNVDAIIRGLENVSSETTGQRAPDILDQTDQVLQQISGQSPIHRWINLFRYEVEIHRRLHQPQDVTAQEVDDRWQGLKAQDAGYAAVLRDALPPLSQALEDVTVGEKWKALKAKFDESIHDLFASLQAAVKSYRPDSRQEKNSISIDWKEVYQSWQDLSARDSFAKERDQLKKKYKVILWADGVWEAIESKQFAYALSCLSALPADSKQILQTTVPGFDFADFKHDLQQIAHRRVAEIAPNAQEKQPRWPDELDEAQQIVNGLQETGFSQQTGFSQLQNIERQLSEWQENLDKLRQHLQWREDEPPAHFWKRVVEANTPPSTADVLKALEEAVENGIELIDRRRIPAELSSAYSVGTLLTLCTLRQTPDEMKTLVDQFEELCPRVQSLIDDTGSAIDKFGRQYKRFEEGYERLQKKRGEINKIEQQLNSLNKNFNEALTVLFAQTVGAGLEAVRNLEYEKAKSHLALAQQFPNNYFQKNEFLESSLLPLENAVSWLEELGEGQKEVIRNLKIKLENDQLLLEAEKMWEQLYGYPPHVTSGWIIRELHDEYNARKKWLEQTKQQKVEVAVQDEEQGQAQLRKEIKEKMENIKKRWEQINGSNYPHLFLKGHSDLIEETDKLAGMIKNNQVIASTELEFSTIIPNEILDWAKKPENWLTASNEEQTNVFKLLCLQQKLILLHKSGVQNDRHVSSGGR